MTHFPVLLQRNLHAQCASQARACVLCAKLLQCCCPRTWPARVPGAMQREASTFLHTSHCTLHTSHLSSFHLVSCLPICQLRSSWLFSCHLSAAQTFSCVGATFNLSRRFCTSAIVERNSCRFFYMPKGVDHKIFTILRSLMPSVDALHQIATASVNMA